MSEWNKKGSLFKYMEPEDVVDEMRNSEGLYQMRIDPADNTKVFLLGALIEDFGSMCYIAEIEYRMLSKSLPTVGTPSPNVLREKFILGDYYELQKKFHIYQVQKKNSIENNYYTLFRSEYSHPIKDVFDINAVTETRADFGSYAVENRIVKMAIDLFSL